MSHKNRPIPVKPDPVAVGDAREFLRLAGAKGGRTNTAKKRAAVMANLKKANIGRAKRWARYRAEKAAKEKAEKEKALKSEQKKA